MMPDSPGPSLARRQAIARLVLLWERLWPALLPAFCILAVFAALALFDLPAGLPGLLHLVVLLAFLAGFAAVLWNGLRRLRWPTAEAVRRRLETDSALPHRPLESLEDRLADQHDPMALALWQVHRRRMLAQLGRLRIGWPHPGAAARDPWALRGAALLLLAVGLGVAGAEAPARLARALSPDLSQPAQPGPEFDLWINPPAYTGLPPTNLPASRTDEVDVPVGSILLARVFGQGEGRPVLLIDEQEVPFERVDAHNHELEKLLEQGARLQLRYGDSTLAGWAIRILPDLAPEVAFAEEAGLTPRDVVRLEYRAQDDYGVVAAHAEMRRTGENGEEVEQLDLPLPLVGARELQEAAYHDLTPHPWAGLEVEFTAVVEDAAGQRGRSEPLRLTLPERQFNHPVAQAVIEQRKNLYRGPDRRASVARALAAIAADPGSYHDDVVAYLALNVAARRLRAESGADSLDEVQRLLWETALRIEDGSLSLAERELRDVQRRLMEALARAAPDEEIERLMNELQQKMQEYLQALAEQALQQMQQGAELQPMDPNQRMVGAEELQRMLDQARELSRLGAKDAAREMLRQLQDMLESLRSGTMQAMSKQMQQGSQAMRELNDLMSRQQRLLDRTFREAQQNRGQRQQGQQGQRGEQGQQGQQGQPGQNGQQGMPGMAGEQEALRRQLGEVMRQLGESFGEIPGALGRADQFMRDSRGALRQGQGEASVQSQTEAIDQMAQGMREMAEQMAQQPGAQGRNGPPMGARETDPMGRPMQNGGMDTNRVHIPEDAELQRAREILDELRRRAGERSRPPDERDYIDRLLRQF